jgi:rubrerythrin
MTYQIKQKLKSLMKDEQKAPHDYWKLHKLLSNPEQKKVVEGIIADERRHYHQLKRIKKQENGI